MMHLRTRPFAVTLAAVSALSLGSAMPTATPAATPTARAGAPWSYSGPTGPSHWGSLDPSYAACSDGSAQSPVNITRVVRRALKNPGFHYVTGRATVVNNGHTVVATPRPGSSMTIDGTSFTLVEVHFHGRGEHEVNGHRYPLEVHFVHRSSTGAVAALGVFVIRGTSTNKAWQPYVRSLDVAPGRAAHPTINWSAMLPRNRQTFRYRGSLTTPPCTEGLRWVVLTTPVRLSGQQIAAFRAAYDHNNRPLQPLHGRKVLLDCSSGS
jgi:carbonic anhydrase